ncbi:hypothetical protein [Tropicimonas sp. IMCC34043]|uniref:hypothetical protein n=1 Tax=Tropicimonas sp. IMCC34043 TaxID=2248760 RepID=UPI0013001CD9|nr:hypothetical protein [Tropicimonas sp. IMCC34043]
MSTFTALYQHFPDQEFAIRRRLKTDECLRTICCDFCDALGALRYWEAAGPEGTAKAAQYRMLVGELAGELAAHLRRPDTDTAGPATSGKAEFCALQNPHDDKGSRR